MPRPYLPIATDMGLGSISNRTVGRMSFALSVRAPENLSPLVRNLVHFVATELFPRPYNTEPIVVIREEPSWQPTP